LATAERITTTGADYAIVATVVKNTAGCNDVFERAAIDTHFQYSAIKPVFEGIIVPEPQ
jgi:hypothetical protein